MVIDLRAQLGHAIHVDAVVARHPQCLFQLIKHLVFGDVALSALEAASVEQPAIGGQRERQIMLMQVTEQIQIGRRDTHQHHRFTVRHRTVKEGDDFIELESMLVEEHTAAFAAAALHGLGKVARQGGVLVHVPCRRNHGDADTLSIRHDEMTERHNH